MTFSQRAEHITETPVEREQDHDPTASLLPFQKLPMQQIKRVRRRTGAGRA